MNDLKTKGVAPSGLQVQLEQMPVQEVQSPHTVL